MPTERHRSEKTVINVHECNVHFVSVDGLLSVFV